jgi:hypothetical protein
MLMMNSPLYPFLRTGSLVRTNSFLGHELIAGPVIGNQQYMWHSEPKVGTHAEPVESVLRRYSVSEVHPPANDFHGTLSLARIESQAGRPWAMLDNCQHRAREAYFGTATSPTANGIALAVGIGLFIKWLAD